LIQALLDQAGISNRFICGILWADTRSINRERIMRTILFSAAAMLWPCADIRAADEADKIIDKAITAHGGAKKLSELKAQTWNAKGIVSIMGMKIDYTGVYSFQAPDRLRFDIEASAGGQKFSMTAATDGKKFWEKMGDQSREMDKKKAEGFRKNLYGMNLSRLLPLKEKGFSFSVTGEEKVGDKPAVGILVSSKGQPDVTLFFDKESGLLVKTLTEAWDEFADKDVPQEVFYMDYKEKNGRKVFQKLLIKRSGATFLEEELSDQNQLEKLDPKTFEKP